MGIPDFTAQGLETQPNVSHYYAFRKNILRPKGGVGDISKMSKQLRQEGRLSLVLNLVFHEKHIYLRQGGIGVLGLGGPKEVGNTTKRQKEIIALLGQQTPLIHPTRKIRALPYILPPTLVISVPDSFLGSGIAAVAHKMGRRYIRY